LRKIAVIDIGTNSMRLAVARIDPNHDFHTLALQKEVVRLGEGEFAHNKITRAAMERGLLVMKKFGEIARKHQVAETVAVATAAVREAQNRAEFVERAMSEAGVEVHVVSGLEEARLIYLGVASGVSLSEKKALFVDIGGGTTELIVGDSRDCYLLGSLKLGAIRLADMFLRGESGPISKQKYKSIRDYALAASNLDLRKVREHGFATSLGSSGTIMNLAEITARRLGENPTSINNYVLDYRDLADTITMLRELTLDERRSVPGINPERADIIISGAAVLDAVMTGAGAQSIIVSDRALRDGLLIDHLFQEERVKEEYLSTSPRMRSILSMCRSCRYEEAHAEKVSDLALSLFDQLGRLRMHPYGEAERELLRYSALAHDVGTFISHLDHQKHSYYLIRNWGVLGFRDDEIEVIATTAMCHRKLSPRKVAQGALTASSRRLIEVLAAILRVADSLDRSQLGCVKGITLSVDSKPSRAALTVSCSEDCSLEMWSIESKKALFEQVFDLRLSVETG